jgi:hypothetical protein
MGSAPVFQLAFNAKSLLRHAASGTDASLPPSR